MNPSKTSPGWVWLPWLGLIVLTAALAAVTQADPDLWGHVRFGLDMLAGGGLPAVDPYSFTQDRPWLNHEWLSELAMALAWTAGGSAGLSLLKAALVLAVLFIVWGALQPVRTAARLACLAWLVFCAAHMTATLRPQLWSFLGMALLCRWLAESPRLLPLRLPALFAVWANLHGGWVVGLGVLAAWQVGSVAEDRSLAGRAAAIVAAALAGTLVTPYGIQLWGFIAETVRFERQVTEWLPLSRDGSIVEWTAWAGTCLLALLAVAGNRPGRVARGLALAMLAYASLRVMRMGSLFAVAAVVLAAGAVRVRWPARPRAFAAPRSFAEVAIVLLPGLLALAAAWQVGTRAVSCIPVIGPWAPDPVPVRLLSGAASGRLVTHFDWGQYALWHLGPGVRVSIDGRRETIYSAAALAAHDEVVQGTTTGLERLEFWAPDYVWLPATSQRTRDWLAARGYDVVYQSEAAFVAVRGRLPASPSVRSSSRRCFPE